MHKNRLVKNSLLLLGCFLVFVGKASVISAEEIDSFICDDFEDRITPSEKAWSSLTYAQQIEESDIASEKLLNISTDELLKKALDYPFAIDAFMYDDLSDGVEYLTCISNVFNNLLKRENLPETLLKLYEYEQSNELYKMIKDMLVGYLWKEEKLNAYQKMAFIDLQKENKSNAFGDFLYSVLADNNLKFAKMTLATTTEGFSSNGSIVTSIYGTTCIEGTYTKYGKSSQCFRYSSGDFTDAQKSVMNNTFNNVHSNWTYRGTATKKYNCHSYCWINQSLSNIYILLNPIPYTTASSYWSLYSVNGRVLQGDNILIYKSGELLHSATALSSSIGTNKNEYMSSTRVVSKFGQYGVYETSLADAYQAYLGTDYKVYD